MVDFDGEVLQGVAEAYFRNHTFVGHQQFVELFPHLGFDKLALAL